MKKALALILAVCMLFSCAVMVSAAEGISPAVQDSQDSGNQDSGNPQDSGIISGGNGGGGGSSSGSKLGIVSDKTNTGAAKTLSAVAASKAASDAATKAIADAQAAGQSSANASVTFNNVNSLSPAAIKAINDAVAAAEAKSGVDVNLTINIDKVVNGKVITRITLDPADLANVTETVNTTVSYDVTDKAVKSVLDRFNKYFTNDIVVVSYGEASPLAGVNAEFCAKLDLSALNTDTIVVYSYDRATNVYTRVAAPNFFVDVNGYAHVTAPFGGSLIITDAPLTSK